MKKIILWLWLLTKRQLKSVLFLMLLLIVPLTSFVVSQTESFKEAAVNRVALYRCDDDLAAQNTISELTEVESAYDFYLCESKEEVYDAVLKGDAVCGYIFNENISELIKKGEYKDHITVVKNKDDILANMVNEVVFAAYFEEFTRQIMVNYIMENEKFAHVAKEAVLQLEGAYESYVNGNGTFKVEFESLGISGTFSDTEEIESETVTFPLRGVMAVLIFMGGLLGVVNWLSDYEKGVFKTLGYDFVNLSRFFYAVIPAILLGISTVLSLLMCSQNTNLLYEILVMIIYIIAIGIVGTLCTWIFKSSILMVSVTPVIIMVSLLVCPVFIDLSPYVPVIGLVRRLFIPFYYMILY